jgi:hypothetical protein
LRADETGDKVTVGVTEREGFSTVESCFGRQIIRHSVFEELGIRFADSLEESSATAFSRKETFSRNVVEEKEMKI